MTEIFRPDIEEVFEHYGARILAGRGDWAKATCPLTAHDDMSPSASVNVEAGKWRCFSCDISGDAYDLIGENEGVGFVAAQRFAEKHFGGSDSPVRASRSRPGDVLHRPRNRRGGGTFVPPWNL